MGVTSEGACNMPEHMMRRGARYYFRRVVPKDLQAVGEPREFCRSLRTSDFSEAKRRLHLENVRFDEWVRAQRVKLSETRQMAPANENAQPSSIADAMEQYNRESEEFFAQLYPDDEESALPYAQWLV